MSKTTVTAKINPEGRLVRVHEDGRELPLPAGTTASGIARNAIDPDNPPITPERLKRMRRVPRVKTLRRALQMTQEAFAERYHIPVGTLRDWEQGRTEPDAPARAFLKVIAADPAQVEKLLKGKRGPQ